MRVQLLQPFRVIFYAPIEVAQHGGFFAAEGLELDVTITGSGPWYLDVLCRGETDIVMGGPMRTDRKNKSPFRAAPPAACPPVLLAGAHLLRPPLHAPPARRGSPPERLVARRSAVERLVLDMRLRMGAGSASGVPWGDDLGTGDLGRLFHTGFQGSSGMTHPAPAHTSPPGPHATAWA